MQDRYEIPVSVRHDDDFNILRGCTFDGKAHDACFTQWNTKPFILAQRGTYATNGLATTLAPHSNYADDSKIDLYTFGGPAGATRLLRNTASLPSTHSKRTLRTTDPLDTPTINFNYFNEGTTTNGADHKDLSALVQAINISRQALGRYSKYTLLGGSDFTEVTPGSTVQSEADLEQYVKDRAWDHHACCTAPIGADADKNAVLDSNFRVRGVSGLRIVDASVFPKIPGIFIQAPIMIISEKAADIILNGA